VGKHLKGPTAIETHRAILDLIRSSGVVSRIDLSDRSGLTGASISRIVRQLIDDGLIAETGFEDSTGGKRRTLLQLNPTSRHAIGIALDAATITYVITDLAGEVIGRLESVGIAHKSPRTVVRRIAEELVGLLASAGVDSATLLGIGIAVAGRQDSAHHVLRSNPNATEWELFALEDTLSAATGLPVVIENDSTCAAIGEFWLGRIPASADFATVYLADGFGLGLVTKGDVYRGSSSNVGEIGHMVLDVNGPDCWCGSRGCLEILATPKRIVTLGFEDETLRRELGLSGDPMDTREDAALIARAAAAGRADCVALFEESAFYLSKALLSTTNLLDLDQIILAGPGFTDVGDIYLRIVTEELARLSFVRAVHPTRVGLSKSGPNSAALGAASLVLHRQLTPHQTSSRLAMVR
jgi:predicted NBD/HSP70 family sugar kinase